MVLLVGLIFVKFTYLVFCVFFFKEDVKIRVKSCLDILFGNRLSVFFGQERSHLLAVLIKLGHRLFVKAWDVWHALVTLVVFDHDNALVGVLLLGCVICNFCLSHKHQSRLSVIDVRHEIIVQFFPELEVLIRIHKTVKYFLLCSKSVRLPRRSNLPSASMSFFSLS